MKSIQYKLSYAIVLAIAMATPAWAQDSAARKELRHVDLSGAPAWK